MADEIFRLDTQPSGAPSGVTDAYMARITPNSRNAIAPNVHMSQQSSTDQEFTFSPSGTDWWLPSRSYFRIRVRAQGRVSKGLTADGSKKPYQNMSGPIYEEGELGFNFLSGNPSNHVTASQGGPLSKQEVDAIMAPSLPNEVAAADVGLQQVMSRVAPAKGFCAALFDTATVKIGDTIVSKVSDNKMHQIDTFKKRTRFSSSQLEGTLGEMGLYQSKVGDPCNEPGAASLTEGYEGGRGRMSAFNHNGESAVAELMWQPPLGIFDYDRALPPSTYTIRLKTHSQNLLRRCVDWSFFRFSPGGQGGTTATAQSIIQQLTTAGSGKQGASARLLDWGIEEIVFYAAIIQGPRADDVKYALDLMETGCTTQQVTSSDGDMTLNFDINSNTRSLGWALQGSTPHYHGDDSNFRYGLLPTSGDTQPRFFYSETEDLFNAGPGVVADININLRFLWNDAATSNVATAAALKQISHGGDVNNRVKLAAAGIRVPTGTKAGNVLRTLVAKYPQILVTSVGAEPAVFPNVLKEITGEFKADLGFHVYPKVLPGQIPNYDYKSNPGGMFIEMDFDALALIPGVLTIQPPTPANPFFLIFLLTENTFNGLARHRLGYLDGVPSDGLKITIIDPQHAQTTNAGGARFSDYGSAYSLMRALYGIEDPAAPNQVLPYSTGVSEPMNFGNIALPALAQLFGEFFITNNAGAVPVNQRVNVAPYLPNTHCRRALPISYETNQLQSWYVSYDGKQYPSEHSQQDTSITTTTASEKKILLKQRWLDTITQNGTFYTANQGESYYNWLQNGPYYFMTWPRQGTANATRLIMNLTFKNRPNAASDEEKRVLHKFGSQEDGQPGSQGETDMQSGRVLLFYNHPTAFLIRTRDSRVVQVETPQNSDARFQSILD